MKAIEVKIEFSVNVYPREHIINPHFGHMIDGELKIWLNEQLYFDEPMVALVEFAAYLNQWLTQPSRAGQAVPLAYYTLDLDEQEGALLRLVPINSTEYFIESVWAEFECKLPIRHSAVRAAAETFLQNLDAAIRSFGDTDLQHLFALRV
jgi:hypothetical protein